MQRARPAEARWAWGGRLCAVVMAGFALLLEQAVVAQPLGRDELDRRALREIATCASVGRTMSGSDRGALVSGQIARLTKDLADARRKRADREKAEARPGGPSPAFMPGESPPDEWFRETAAIYDADGKRFCSGVLISGNAILTAGHCVCSLKLGPTKTLTSPPPVVRFGPNIEVNNHYTERRVITTKTKLFYEKLCAEGETKGAEAFAGKDAAIIFFDTKIYDTNSAQRKPLKIEAGEPDLSSDEVAPARVATTGLLLSRSLTGMLAVGYGINTNFQNKRVKTIGCIDIVSRICGFPESQKELGCAIGSETVLRDAAARADTCFGDSGGPVFAIVDTGKAFTYFLAGITSRSVDRRSGSCGQGGVYTLITPNIVDWIRKQGVTIPFYDYPEQ